MPSILWFDARRIVNGFLNKPDNVIACRAGMTTPLSCGETISTDLANYDGNYVYGNGKKANIVRKRYRAVDFKPNPCGLYDMQGNVWEWTRFIELLNVSSIIRRFRESMDLEPVCILIILTFFLFFIDNAEEIKRYNLFISKI